MNYITIVTPENIAIEYRLAGLGSRLAAAFIDTLIQMAALAVVYAVILFGVMRLNLSHLDRFDINGIGSALLIISLFVIYLGYYTVFEFLMKGQTPGKRLLKLRVMRNNGRPLTLGHSIVRNILRYFVDITGAGVICILFNKQCKRVGDMAAATIVVAENPDINIIRLNRDFEYYSADKYQNLRLNDDEYYLLVEFLDRGQTFLDNGVHLRQRLARYFACKFETQEYEITDTLLTQLAQVNRR
ncbi:MAG: RDD family protein [Clostridiales bacterium]|jgi:uncharacterized RDD family membrane protein YckC|nr:RDD family protein [Clostridiales bacterium]